jgi:hypothetical protein
MQRQEELTKDYLRNNVVGEIRNFVSNYEVIPMQTAVTPVGSAQPLPPVTLTDLHGEPVTLQSRASKPGVRLTILTVAMNTHMMDACDVWVDFFRREFGARGDTQVQQISVLDKLTGVSLLRPWILRNLRAEYCGDDTATAADGKSAVTADSAAAAAKGTVSPADRSSEVLVAEPWTDKEKIAMGTPTRMSAYVYLLDATGRVRYRGASPTTDAQLEHLGAACVSLLNLKNHPIQVARGTAPLPHAADPDENAKKRNREMSMLRRLRSSYQSARNSAFKEVKKARGRVDAAKTEAQGRIDKAKTESNDKRNTAAAAKEKSEKKK